MKPKLLGGRTGSWTITMQMMGGNRTDLTSTDWDLHDAVVDELKAVSTFQRQVVKTWNYKLGDSGARGLIKKSLL